MSFFKKFYVSVEHMENCNENQEQVDVKTKNDFNRTFLSPDIFTDPSSANDYVCKICHFMAVDPLEHVPGPDVKCSNIFCLPCVETYCDSGLSSCPAEGCLTTGFNAASLRELGIREIARLSNLTLRCEFNCNQVIPYRDYWTHRDICPTNPTNFCKICDSPRISETHSCRSAFVELKETGEILKKENGQLKNEIDMLRRELDLLRFERAGKIKNGSSTVADDENKCSSPDNRDTNGFSTLTSHDSNNNNSPRRPGFNKINKVGKEKRNSVYESVDSKPSSGLTNEDKDDKKTGFLRGSMPQYKFHSNIPKHRPEHRIRLIFHYAERSYNLNEVQASLTFRTLRSLLTDMMKFDPGIMLLLQHRTLNDRQTVGSCGFKPGSNAISLVPFDTPDYNEPGFRLGLYRFKDSSDPLDGLKGFRQPTNSTDSQYKSKEAIYFYSNCLNHKSSEDEDITLNFNSNGKLYSMEVKKEQTIGEIRSMIGIIINKSPGKMMYITHLLIEDDMTVQQCNISGTTDITLLPSTFPVNLESAQTLNMIRFRGGKLAKRSPNSLKSRTSSMASLV
uniref:RING-type domain-containing protein n=1 Tax=Tetranychus urticae TaxID=32264 RepID=T1JQD3_TETUR